MGKVELLLNMYLIKRSSNAFMLIEEMSKSINNPIPLQSNLNAQVRLSYRS
jgi:hypothetical protein